MYFSVFLDLETSCRLSLTYIFRVSIVLCSDWVSTPFNALRSQISHSHTRRRFSLTVIAVSARLHGSGSGLSARRRRRAEHKHIRTPDCSFAHLLLVPRPSPRRAPSDSHGGLPYPEADPTRTLEHVPFQNPSAFASLASGIGAHFCVLVSAGVPYAPLLILLYFQ